MTTRYESAIRDGLNEAADHAARIGRCDRNLSNTEILCFILGWQGGTIHQVAQQLDVTNNLIMDADYEVMQWLCRLAQLRNRTSSRNRAALTELSGQIDGGEECRGRDSEITTVINILEGTIP